jgi:NAD(P)-dependent dehydrogenase (short-subunit alcohol dehydrogenase family)
LASACPRKIILAGRSVDKISPVVEEITKINPKIQATIVAVDLCDNASIRKAAAEINANVATIDVIMCCAGTMAVGKFTPSADGVESQFGANYLGHFLLTNLIIAKLAKTATFVTVTSMGYELAEVNFEKPNFEVIRLLCLEYSVRVIYT